MAWVAALATVESISDRYVTEIWRALPQDALSSGQAFRQSVLRLELMFVGVAFDAHFGAPTIGATSYVQTMDSVRFGSAYSVPPP